MDSEVTTNPVKPVFNREREGNNSIKRLQTMLSSSSLRSSGTIDEEKPVKLVPDLEKPVDENKKQDLKNISEERDDTMSDEKRLIDFSPDQVRPDQWQDRSDKRSGNVKSGSRNLEREESTEGAGALGPADDSAKAERRSVERKVNKYHLKNSMLQYFLL